VLCYLDTLEVLFLIVITADRDAAEIDIVVESDTENPPVNRRRA
jgi:hypothetical protein